jgi:hypothetical protein
MRCMCARTARHPFGNQVPITIWRHTGSRRQPGPVTQQATNNAISRRGPFNEASELLKHCLVQSTCAAVPCQVPTRTMAVVHSGRHCSCWSSGCSDAAPSTFLYLLPPYPSTGRSCCATTSKAAVFKQFCCIEKPAATKHYMHGLSEALPAWACVHGPEGTQAVYTVYYILYTV